MPYIQHRADPAPAPPSSLWMLPYFCALLAPNAIFFAFNRGPISALFLLVALLGLAAWHIALAWSRWAVFLLLPVFVLLPFELYYLANYREAAGLHVLVIALETPLDQVQDYLHARWLPIGLGLLLSIGIWAKALVACPEPAAGTRARRLARGAACLVVITALVGVFGDPAGQGPGTVRAGTQAGETNSVAWSGAVLTNLVRGAYPLGRIATLLEYKSELEQMRAATARRRATITGAHLMQPGASEKRTAVVLVVGESANPRRWSLYGYERKTTPHLDQRNDLIVVRDMISAWPSTLQAVPVMLTRKSPADSRMYTSEPSLINVLGQAGFETHWLSTQGSGGYFDRSIAELAGDAVHRQFVAGQTALKTGQPGDDGQLLPLLREALARPASNVFVVLHTQGSHAPYWERHPQQFERFQPALREYETFEWRKDKAYRQAMSNSYDNSVLYTDQTLDAMIRTIEASGRQASLLYASDHGESLPDDQCSQFGHGFTSQGNFRIPSFVWLSADHPARANGAELAQLRHNSALRTTSSSIFPTLLALAGVEAAVADASLNLLSPQFREPVRIVNVPEPIDFDRARMHGGCEWVAR